MKRKLCFLFAFCLFTICLPFHVQASRNYTEREEIIFSGGDVAFYFKHPDYTELTYYIKQNIDKNFDIKDYKIKLFDSYNGVDGHIFLNFLVNDMETNAQYTIEVKNNTIQQISLFRPPIYNLDTSKISDVFADATKEEIIAYALEKEPLAEVYEMTNIEVEKQLDLDTLEAYYVVSIDYKTPQGYENSYSIYVGQKQTTGSLADEINFKIPKEFENTKIIDVDLLKETQEEKKAPRYRPNIKSYKVTKTIIPMSGCYFPSGYEHIADYIKQNIDENFDMKDYEFNGIDMEYKADGKKGSAIIELIFCVDGIQTDVKYKAIIEDYQVKEIFLYNQPIYDLDKSKIIDTPLDIKEHLLKRLAINQDYIEDGYHIKFQSIYKRLDSSTLKTYYVVSSTYEDADGNTIYEDFKYKIKI